MLTNHKFRPELDRRAFLSRAGGGFGALALASLLDSEPNGRQANATQSKQSSPKAKSVIWLFMNGGPSGIDLFDEKPALKRWDGKAFPGKVETLFPHPGPIMKSPFKFRRRGECGATVSEVFPHVAQHVDDITFLHACQSEAQNHVPACYAVNTGSMRFGAPCVGSWVNYGLGTENKDLPGFVVMYDPRSAPEGGANLWDSGYLPGNNQGVPIRASDHPILYLKRPEELSGRQQKAQLKLLRGLNQQHLLRHPDDKSNLQSRIQSLETAFRMQDSAAGIVDVSRETRRVQNMYGMNSPPCKVFGTQLLMARRMVESGVRFIQIYHGGFAKNWDQHAALEQDHRKLCYESDRPIAGLLRDLKQRGLLESTLVVWGGEFGRGPTSQDRDGRDHNPFGFTMWLAGGGIKKGFSYGETDELGYQPVENPVSMHDLQATILHQLGITSDELTYYHNGRDQSLTNGFGSVIKPIIA
ncbi:MAG: DUF1501 domain-containing protein [Planctomycetaceae bacterium]|nr:DUF1501 domain-containing protein [Planctomycetaceae bacterium]